MDQKKRTNSPIWGRPLIGEALLALIYLLVAQLSLSLAFANTNASPVWPPSGLAFAAIFLGGRRWALAIAAGAFAANLVTFMANQVPFSECVLMSLAIAIGNALEALTAVYLMQRNGKSTQFLRQPHHVYIYAFAALMASAISASIGTASLIAGGVASFAAAGTVWTTWWLGDVTGMLIVAPALVAWFGAKPVSSHPCKLTEVAALVAAVAIAAQLSFGEWFAENRIDSLMVYLFIPCIAWAAYRHGQRGAASVSLLIAAIALWATIHEAGPFADATINASLISLDSFIVLCGVTGLLLAASFEPADVRPKPEAARRGILAPTLILLGGVGATILAWHLIASQTERGARDLFDFVAKEIQERIIGRMAAYEQILRGGGALFAASESVERNEWRTYVEKLDIETQYPGIQGMGFSKVIASDELESHVRTIRGEGFPDYSVKPLGVRDSYTSIIFLEPFNWRNRRAFGYDMLTESVRREAMIHARDTGDVAISGKVVLIQETNENVQAGFLMYLPIYRNGAPTATKTERQSALMGYVYSPFRMDDLMRGILGRELDWVRLEIFDGNTMVGDTRLYESHSKNAIADNPRFAFSKLLPFSVENRAWSARVTALPAFNMAIDRQKEQIVLVAGMVISLLLFTVVRSLAVTREKAVAMAARMTAALRASEAKFSSLAESATEAIVIADESGNIVSWNPGAHSMFGYSAKEIGGRHLTALAPETFRPILDRALTQLKGEEASGESMEIIGSTKSGHMFPLELSISTWRTGAGRYYSGILRDISERVRAQEDLRNSEERFRLLVEGVTDYAILMLDPDGFVVSWNSGAERIQGYRLDEILGRHFSIFYLPEDIKRGDPQRALEEAASKGRFEIEGWRIRKNGTPYWAGATITALRDQTGSLRGFGKVTRDLTEWRESNARLHTTLAFQTAILGSANLSIIATDPAGTIVSFNCAAQRMLGYSSDEVIGRQTPTLIHDSIEVEERAAWLSASLGYPVAPGFDVFVAKARKGEADEQEWTYIRKDGSRFPVLLSVTIIRGIDGDIIGFLGIASDISDRKQKEHTIQAALAEKETLLKEVYHRVKNNLQVITSLLNMQARALPEGPARVALREGVDRVRAMALVHEKLYQSKNLSQIPLNEYIRDLCQQMEAAMATNDRGITISADIEPIDIGLERAAPLGLAINELISNSLKHAFPNNQGGTVTVRLAKGENDVAILEVSDNGVGFSKGNPPAASTSLGLTLVEMLSKQLDGEFFMENRGGAYSRFTFPLTPLPT
jgi:PAS domain S-box-containing protein